VAEGEDGFGVAELRGIAGVFTERPFADLACDQRLADVALDLVHQATGCAEHTGDGGDRLIGCAGDADVLDAESLLDVLGKLPCGHGLVEVDAGKIEGFGGLDLSFKSEEHKLAKGDHIGHGIVWVVVESIYGDAAILNELCLCVLDGVARAVIKVVIVKGLVDYEKLGAKVLCLSYDVGRAEHCDGDLADLDVGRAAFKGVAGVGVVGSEREVVKEFYYFFSFHIDLQSFSLRVIY